MAYIKAIRSAQHFVYIENQYFLGSSYNWPKYTTAGTVPLIFYCIYVSLLANIIMQACTSADSISYLGFYDANMLYWGTQSGVLNKITKWTCQTGANHLIPMELTLKICSKIREGKRFSVYVVIPMWPEGIADSAPVQEILYFQVILNLQFGLLSSYTFKPKQFVFFSFFC